MDVSFNRCLLVVVALLALAGQAQSFEYFVQAGNATPGATCVNARTASTPKLTINAGAACLAAGDTLTIKAGVYNEVLNNVIPSGTAGAPTIVRSETQYGAIIRPTAAANGQIIIIRQKNYITFDGLVVDGLNISFAEHIVAYGPNTHITVTNSEIMNGHDPGYPNCWGIATEETDSFWTISHNKIHHVGADSTILPAADARQSYGIYLTAHDSLVEYNEIYNNGGYGIHQYTHDVVGAGANNIFRFNTIHHNGQEGILFASGALDNIVNHNIFYNNSTRSSAAGHRGAIIIGGYGTYARNKIWNNTMWNNLGNCIWLGAPTGDDTEIRNNICYGNTNDVIPMGTSTVKDHNLEGPNPNFANTGIADFSLVVPSPAINTGINVGLMYQGSAPDMGAVESMTSPATLATFYIATDGLDTRTCEEAKDPATPKQTFANTAACGLGGSTFYWNTGTYTERIDSAIHSIAGGSSWSAPTTLASRPGHTATFAPTLTAADNIVTLRNASNQYIRLDALTFNGLTTAGNGVVVSNGAGHVRVTNSTLMNAVNQLVMFTGCAGCQLGQNTLHDNQVGHMVLVQAGSTDTMIENNLLYNYRLCGIADRATVSGTNARTMIRNNIVRDALVTSTDAAICTGEGTDAVIMGNIVYNGYGGIRVVPNSLRALIAHNTVWNMTTQGLWLDATQTGAVLTNNISWQAQGITLNGSTAVQRTNLTTDPLFTNAAGGNFILGALSTAINAGTPLTTAAGTGVSGTALVVQPQDARYFSDGAGMHAGDTIRVGPDTVTVTAVNTGTNTVTITPATTWANGAPVSLPYNGSLPDIGALEKSAVTLVATSLQFIQQPNTTVMGVTIAPPITVRIRDQFGDPFSSTATVALVLGANPGSSTLSGTVSQPAVDGLATFGNLSLNNAGNAYTLVASSSGLTGATSTPFDITVPPTGPTLATTTFTTGQWMHH